MKVTNQTTTIDRLNGYTYSAAAALMIKQQLANIFAILHKIEDSENARKRLVKLEHLNQQIINFHKDILADIDRIDLTGHDD